MQQVSTMNTEVKSEDAINIEIPQGFMVFCDMGGTLVDTDYANYLSYRRAITEVTRGKYDVPFSGTRLNREGLKKRIPSLTDGQCEEIVSLKSKYSSGFISETRLNPALAAFIRKRCQTNETVLVTCCREKRAVETLMFHKLFERFTNLICWESLSEIGSSNKYESALSMMGARPDAVLVFENEAADIEKAALAGVPRRNIICVVLGRRVKMP